MADQTDKNVYSILDLVCPEEMHFKANLVAQILLKMQSAAINVREASIILRAEESVIYNALSGQFHNIEREEICRWLDEILTK